MSVGAAVSSQIKLSGSSGVSHVTKEVEMKTHTSCSSEKTKAIRSSARRQFVVSFVAAASFALLLGQGGPSAKAGS